MSEFKFAAKVNVLGSEYSIEVKKFDEDTATG